MDYGKAHYKTPMDGRKHIRNILLVVAVGSVLYMAIRESIEQHKVSPNAATAQSSDSEIGPSAKLIVYYFSEGKECATCENIPLYAREALEKHFAGELASGLIEWRAIDVDEPRNEHFISKFGIYTKSIFLVRVDHGKEGASKNLDAVWDFVYDKPAFIEYIRKQMREELDAAP